jgi:PelA/Pel-15E family pectate lyase
MNSLKIIILAATSLLFWDAAAQDLQADNMLLFQRSNGGWSKQFKGKAFDYNIEFSADQKKDIAVEAAKDDANIDNGSTAKEIRYLVSICKKINNPKYLAAAENGIRFLLKAQYANGGWPQYYPDKSSYRAEITYNDNAMINALNILQDVAVKQNDFDVVNTDLIEPSIQAIKKGIDCILKTQIMVNGTLTAWCQQYDEKTLQPAKARAYELPSISGSESGNIVDFLLSQPDPSQEIKKAITAAIKWFKLVKISGYKLLDVPAPGTPKGKNRELIADSSAVLWARYYEIGTNKPFFCDRDGIVKYSLQEIGYERRNGYSWYGEWPKNILEKKYPKWLKKYGN